MLNEYEKEVKERWGDTDAYKQSTSRTSKYTKDDFAAAKVDQEAATEMFVVAFGNSYAVRSELQKNLAVMYVEDHRFKAYYDGRVRGLAQYVHDAILAQ
jgi:hypothetical protein